MLVFYCFVLLFFLFFFKQKTAYEMRISDWSSDVCSSDLHHACAGDDLRRDHAGVRRPCQLADTDDDRCAGHGAATDEQLVVLDSAVRVHLADRKSVV